MKILGIETSCDETGVGVYDSDSKKVVHRLTSQIEIHKRYGGVVPELASRDHIKKLLPLVEETLKNANCGLDDIDGIGYTAGPGLMGALLVGASFAKSLAWSLHVPVIGINHLEAHILAAMLEKDKPSLPFLALLVSGGHTLLVLAEKLGSYSVLGETLDDAVGECFDKTAKLIGLDYPGGPEIAKLAKSGKKDKFTFPRPMINRKGLNFSFSGLKTHVRNVWNNLDDSDVEQNRADVARALEDAIVDTLTIKCRRALESTQMSQLVLAGGVAANKSLRDSLTTLMKKQNGSFYCPRGEFCTDNGAMVAYTGYCHIKNGHVDDDLSVNVYPKWHLSDVEA